MTAKAFTEDVHAAKTLSRWLRKEMGSAAATEKCGKQSKTHKERDRFQGKSRVKIAKRKLTDAGSCDRISQKS